MTVPIRSQITAIEYYVPDARLDNGELAHRFPEWPAQKILDKTGIASRRIAASEECASDLGVAAARKLFDKGPCRPQDIDFVLFCSLSRDYILPATACLIQDRLSIPTSAGALDFSLGCSGYVYGLGLAHGLIATKQAKRVLLITAETISKFVHPDDQNVRTLFGDAGAATLVEGVETHDIAANGLGPFVYGTDGSGGRNIMVAEGGARIPSTGPHPPRLFMDGPEVFNFTLSAVPAAVNAVLEAGEVSCDDIDLFVFHQANLYMLQHLRKKMKIPESKFLVAMENVGNTSSASIPIALRSAAESGRLKAGSRVVLVGFGVGYSWSASLVRWSPLFGTR